MRLFAFGAALDLGRHSRLAAGEIGFPTTTLDDFIELLTHVFDLDFTLKNNTG